MKQPSVFTRFMWLVVGFAIICWVAYGWTAMTGTTFSGRISHEGRNATAKDVAHGRTLAMNATLIAAAFVAVWLATRERGS